MKIKIILLGIVLLCSGCASKQVAPTENNQKTEATVQEQGSSSPAVDMQGIATPPPPPPAPPTIQ